MWHFERFANTVAIVGEDGTSSTYAQLIQYGNDLASHMPSRQLVFQLCSNTLGAIVGYTCLMEHQHVPLMLDKDITPHLLTRLLDEYRPGYIWLPADKVDLLTHPDIVYAAWGYVLIKYVSDQRSDLHHDLGLLLTTSGSTGSVKLVRLSYSNVVENTRAIVDFLGLDASDKAMTTLPMNYTYGLSVINTHLWVGATLVLSEKSVMQREFWEAMTHNQVTSLAGVPYTYEMLHKLLFFRRNLPSLRLLTQAGGKLSAELHRKFAEYAVHSGKQFVVMYGATEATARMGYLPSASSLEKCGSIGIAIPGGRFSLCGEDGQQVMAADTVGELVYEGRNVSLGYAQSRADLAKGDERGGILYTGDMARIDADGFYYIVGRKNRFLKIFGNRVGLDETEQLIRTCFADMECACTGTDDAMRIFITAPQKTDEVRRFLAETTKLHMTAFHVTYIPEIPKNAAGKILYQALEEQHD